jgi:ribonuclease HI
MAGKTLDLPGPTRRTVGPPGVTGGRLYPGAMPLTAKYATTCGVCAGAIQPGEDIVDTGGGRNRRWAHVTCPPGLFEVEAPARGTLRQAQGASPAVDALSVWTDGACSGNPGPGGWAWATQDGRQDSGGAPLTTNQRMEIQAALEAVRTLGGPLVVVSDSTYVVNCFRDRWWQGWLARGWLTSAKKPVANRDLWEPLVTMVVDRGDVSFRWVKGHSGDPMNDLVDQLAVAAGQRQR